MHMCIRQSRLPPPLQVKLRHRPQERAVVGVANPQGECICLPTSCSDPIRLLRCLKSCVCFRQADGVRAHKGRHMSPALHSMAFEVPLRLPM